MKHLFFLILAFQLTLTTSLKAQNTEEAAIKAVIEKETNSFFQRDFAAWESTFVQADYAFQAWNNRKDFDASVSYNSIAARIGNYIKKHPTPTVARVVRKNFIFKFYDNSTVFVTFDQYNGNKKGQARLSKEIRLMEKQDGQWKIAMLAAFWDYKQIFKLADLE